MKSDRPYLSMVINRLVDGNLTKNNDSIWHGHEGRGRRRWTATIAAKGAATGLRAAAACRSSCTADLFSGMKKLGAILDTWPGRCMVLQQQQLVGGEPHQSEVLVHWTWCCGAALHE